MAEGLDELGIARAIAAGEITSPQRYENIWLFALRITGTGASYRRQHDEYVWRDAAVYLNDDFLARCNGLPVVWQHPEKSVLDSKEYADRVIGAIMLPYIKGDEVWGIAKIHDEEAAKEMSDKQLSTSPGVVFRDPTVNSKVQLKDGSTLLIEGKPSLLDHLAICDLGVWDKSGPPLGILNETLVLERADSMPPTEDEKAAAAAADRKDADAGQKLDKLLSHFDAVVSKIDSVSSRLDAMEMADKARKDAEEEDKKAKADAARKDRAKADAEEHAAWMKADAETCAKDDADEEEDRKKYEGEGDPKEVAADKARKDRKDRMDSRRKDSEAKAKADAEEKAKADASRVDSQQLADLKREVELLKASRHVPDADRVLLADAQARADGVYQALGSRAPAPMDGETVPAYRIRLARGVQKHSKQWSGIDLSKMGPDVLEIASAGIYADAMVAAREPDDLAPGELREIHKQDPATGQRMTTFTGRGTFIGQMRRPARRLTGINTKAGA